MRTIVIDIDGAYFEADAGVARANVGLSRAIGTAVIVSLVDMGGFFGVAQVFANTQTGLGRVDANSLGQVAPWDAVGKEIGADRNMCICPCRLAG